jgi:hypothetical protein
MNNSENEHVVPSSENDLISRNSSTSSSQKRVDVAQQQFLLHLQQPSDVESQDLVPRSPLSGTAAPHLIPCGSGGGFFNENENLASDSRLESTGKILLALKSRTGEGRAIETNVLNKNSNDNPHQRIIIIRRNRSNNKKNRKDDDDPIGTKSLWSRLTRNSRGAPSAPSASRCKI